MNALVAEGIGVTLGGRTILAGIDLALRPGEVTAVVGPNGAGKSTLLAALVGLRRPERGGVRLAGAPVLDLPPRERARRIGFLPQSPEIAWALEVEALVGLGRIPHIGGAGLTAEDRAAVAAALAATQMTAFAGRDVTSLSGGERARALIARVLAGAPRWLVADEPLAGLDPGHQLDACALLRAFVADDPTRGAILTLHDLGLAARVADRVVVLKDGAVLADGPPREALSPAVLAEAYGVDAWFQDGPDGAAFTLKGRVGPRGDA
ncbi:ABC transporter ATP-binding protein [Caulobacter sp. KR2-114]|uniref:ABC transporter ATP-binding protein n=1 Tax=Caulobacter sp. KR2-114 TaxID=3400912 RepID=UPI003BFD2820